MNRILTEYIFNSFFCCSTMKISNELFMQHLLLSLNTKFIVSLIVVETKRSE